MKILWQDVVIILSFLMYFGAGVSTKFALSSVAVYTTAAVELEANPVAREWMDMKFDLFLLQVLDIAFLGAIYVILRRKHIFKSSEIAETLLTFYTIAIVLLHAQNFLNDLPIALKLWTEIIGGI